MNTHQKGFAIPLVIAIVGILAIGGGVYLVSKNNKKISGNTQTVVSANSKTYQNDTFGFGFDYPSDLTAVSSGPNDEQKKVARGEMISGTMPPVFDSITFSNSAKKELFDVAIFDVTKNEASAFSGSGTACDQRFQIFDDEVATVTRTLVTKNGVSILEEQAVRSNPNTSNISGCYFFKSATDNLIVFNIYRVPQKADFLKVSNLVGDVILPTLTLTRSKEKLLDSGMKSSGGPITLDETQSIIGSTLPTGFVLPQSCSIVGNSRKQVDTSATYWKINCGDKANLNSRATLRPFLDDQGWRSCGFATANADWWKDGIRTGVSEGDDLGTFQLMQALSTDCAIDD